MPRVSQYERTTSNIQTGHCFVELLPFTQIQALEVGSALEPDGLSIKAAQRLCAKWNYRGRQGPLRYSYQVVFEE